MTPLGMPSFTRGWLGLKVVVGRLKVINWLVALALQFPYANRERTEYVRLIKSGRREKLCRRRRSLLLNLVASPLVVRGNLPLRK